MVNNKVELISCLNKYNIAANGSFFRHPEIVGCSQEEIENLEIENNVQLPESYKEILKTIGHKAGRLVDKQEFAFYYPSLKMIQNEIEEFLEDDEGGKLLKSPFPENVFFIAWRYQSDDFHYLIADGSKDSQVYLFDLMNNKNSLICESVWEWVNVFLKDARIL